MSAKKSTSSYLLGLLFGDTLDELICPLTQNLAIALISCKLITFILLEFGSMIDVAISILQKWAKLRDQYMAVNEKKIPVKETESKSVKTESKPVETDPLNSKTELELKHNSVENISHEERIQIYNLKQ